MPTAIEYGLELPSSHNVSIVLAQNGSAGGPPVEASPVEHNPPTTAVGDGWLAGAALVVVVVMAVRRHAGRLGQEARRRADVKALVRGWTSAR